MLTLQATKVRQEWSSVCDDVVRDKPAMITRTRDRMWLSNLDVMQTILEAYQFTAERFQEEDGSITLSLNEIDLVENGKDLEDAKKKMGQAILDYAEEYYENYALYTHAPNRKGHIPHVFKALITNDAEQIGGSIRCRDGRN